MGEQGPSQVRRGGIAPASKQPDATPTQVQNAIDSLPKPKKSGHYATKNACDLAVAMANARSTPGQAQDVKVTNNQIIDGMKEACKIKATQNTKTNKAAIKDDDWDYPRP